MANLVSPLVGNKSPAVMSRSTDTSSMSSAFRSVPFFTLLGLVGVVILTSVLIVGANWAIDTGIELTEALFLLTPLYVFWALKSTYQKGRNHGATASNAT